MYIFILIALFYIFSAQIAYAFVYDNFSGNSLDLTKWNVNCLGGCPSGTGLDTTNQNFRFTPSTASYLYLIGHKFSTGETLDFDFYYVSGRIGFQYGDYPPYPSFFPDNNVLPSSGLYHLHLEFLPNNEVLWNATGPDSFYQSGKFAYESKNPIFYPSEADGEVWYDNFVIEISDVETPSYIPAPKPEVSSSSPSTPTSKIDIPPFLLPIILVIMCVSGFIGYRIRKSRLIEEEKRRKAEERQKKLEEERKQLEEQKRRKAEEAFRKRQLAKGLVEYKDKWVTKSQYARLKEIDIGLDQNFMNMTGYKFEEFIAELFRKMGYRTSTTSKARDKGIDVIAKGHGDIIAIQCKRNKNGLNVGNQAIQMARGSMDYFDANKCIVITNQDFTIDAKEQARRTKNIELWGRRKLHEKVREYFIRDKNESK